MPAKFKFNFLHKKKRNFNIINPLKWLLIFSIISHSCSQHIDLNIIIDDAATVIQLKLDSKIDLKVQQFREEKID